MTKSIRFENVSKVFRLRHQQPFLARELFRMLFQRPSRIVEFVALQDITFDVEKGEAVGVVGRNGAGKSTLLSLVAKTSYPTSGEIEVVGKVGPLLELGAGFHPDLTGYENIFLNAILLGLSRSEVEEQFDAIVDYAELGDFIDAPIRTYSTGMRARLGFAVVAHVDPEVLILDEVLGVGDGVFQAKCQATIRRFREERRTMFLVTHNLTDVLALCDRSLWLDKGRTVRFGPTEPVVRSYIDWLESGAGPLPEFDELS